uniref:Uncharacterized protein n=1 Tax=Amphimedon queenslandica TaxID=400682 RepID=A0A1X7V0D8_AMPQE
MGHGLAFLQSISFILLSFFWLSFDHRLDATLIFAVNKVGQQCSAASTWRCLGSLVATTASDAKSTTYKKNITRLY